MEADYAIPGAAEEQQEGCCPQAAAARPGVPEASGLSWETLRHEKEV